MAARTISFFILKGTFSFPPGIKNSSLQAPGISAKIENVPRHSIQAILKQEASNISFVTDTEKMKCENYDQDWYNTASFIKRQFRTALFPEINHPIVRFYKN